MAKDRLLSRQHAKMSKTQEVHLQVTTQCDRSQVQVSVTSEQKIWKDGTLINHEKVVFREDERWDERRLTDSSLYFTLS